ncbi:hypothetical protein LINPERHAP2_LOCUS37008 [Linum perenne]
MASFNSSCLVLFAVVAIFAAAVSAQELAPAPAPSVETGAGSFSAGVSVSGDSMGFGIDIQWAVCGRG